MFETTEKKLIRIIDEEKGYIWNDLNKLKIEFEQQNEKLNKLEQDAPEHFKKTVGARNKVSEIKNKSEQQYENIEKILKDVEGVSEYFEKIKREVLNVHDEINDYKNNSKVAFDDIEINQSNYFKAKESVDEVLTSLKGLADEKENLASRIDLITNQVEASEDFSKKLKALQVNIVKERNEIHDIYQEVFGSSYEDEDGEEQHISGLKNQLESSYVKIKEDVNSLSTEINELKSLQNEKIINFEEVFDQKVDELISKGEKQRQGIVDKISSLLPSALTAGLSGAYVDKIKSERLQLEKHEESFNRAIVGLIICSSIPFLFSIFRVLFLSESFTDVIKDTPTLFSLMLPVYAPILWVAYSSNKSYKLSKRLIEEYTHKEVSSKTFEGLSTQISNIGEDDTSGELRSRLLFNLLHVNSENPGKLISDYNTSDHPIIDVIDKSSKLADSIDRLDNVPILGKIMKHLDEKNKIKLKEKAKAIEETVSVHVESEKNSDLNIETRQ